MKQRVSGLAVVVLSTNTAATALAQADPGIGSWKMNAEKSKFTSMPAPKSVTRTAEAAGDAVKVSYEGEAADGSPIAYSFTCAYDGKECPDTGSGVPYGADTIALKRISASRAEAARQKGWTRRRQNLRDRLRGRHDHDHRLRGRKGKSTGNAAVLDKQ